MNAQSLMTAFKESVGTPILGVQSAASPVQNYGTNTEPKTLFSDMESGHSSLEAAAAPLNPTTTDAPFEINWALVVGIAGLVLTLFWVLKHS